MVLFKATDFTSNTENTDNFKFFKYKAKLLEHDNAQDDNVANGVFKNATVVMPLKYLGNFWESLEMPLFNCKVELKLRWT